MMVKAKKLGLFLIVILIFQTVSVMASGQATGKVTIRNISQWHHPTKDVMQRYHIAIKRVELLRNKTYPIFYVAFPMDLGLDNIEFYRDVLQEVSFANGYWDYELRDPGRKLTVQVRCDRVNRLISNVTVNGDPVYYKMLLNKQFTRVTGLLNRTVPEIAAFNKVLEEYSAEGQETVTLIYRLDAEPNVLSDKPLERNYYEVYVGENHQTHTNRWNTFFVRKDLKRILVMDLSGGTISLETWRASMDGR